jgi:hypothetical protein
MKKTFVSHAFFVLALLMVPASALGYRFHYRAADYHSEPRFDRNCLSSVDVSVMGGSTKNGRNGDKNKADLLNIYGAHDLSRAFQGVPKPLDLSAAHTIIVDDMNNNNLVNKGANFGKLLYTGKFSYIGADVTLTQNFCNGFFAQVVIPVHKLEVSNVAFTDLTADGDKDGNWLAFLNSYTALLAAYDLAASDTKDTTVGDIVVYGGWTYNNDTIDYLDFLDVTIKSGLSIPTARERKTTQAFSIPGGYNGHVGIPLSFDMALGLYDWFTFGAHVGGQFFLKHDVTARMKTNSTQNGFFKFAQGAAREDLGNLWDIGTYLKADHIFGGFSLMVGYNYTAQEDTTLAPVDTSTFVSATVNNDEMLKKWRMHAVNVAAEYDFAQEGQCYNPKIGFFYSHPVAGKRIFNTNVFGGNAGLNITWKF